jgi:hypothetical protein
MIKASLFNCGLSLSNIFFIVTDAAANNLKFAKITGIPHQKCLNHMLNTIANKFIQALQLKPKKANDKSYESNSSSQSDNE